MHSGCMLLGEVVSSGVRNARVLFCVVAQVWVFVTCARDVLACSPPLGIPHLRIPPQIAEMPSNLVRFRVLDATHVGKITLRTEKGERVATRYEADVVRPVADPRPGTVLVLEYPVQDRLRNVGLSKYRFKVLPPVALQLRPAELIVKEQGVEYPASATHRTAFVRLHYGSPDAMGNAPHLMEAKVTVDGRAYHFDGGSKVAFGSAVIELESSCQPRADATSGWDEDTCGALYRVPSGTHTVTVTPHVLGEVDQSASVSLRVTLECGSEASADAASATSSAVTAGPGANDAVVHHGGTFGDTSAREVTGSGVRSAKSPLAPSKVSGCAIGLHSNHRFLGLCAAAWCVFGWRRRAIAKGANFGLGLG
jgi:hypothetical protein